LDLIELSPLLADDSGLAAAEIESGELKN